MALLRNWVIKGLSAVNYYYRTVSIFHHSSKKVIAPAFKVNFSEAETSFLTACAQSFNFEIDYSSGYRQKEISLTKLKEVTLLGNSGALILNEKIITESVFDARRLSISPAWRMPAFMMPTRKNGLFTAIFHFPWAETSNYHWFFDCLPRVYALLQSITENITLIMPSGAPAFQVESLQFLLKDHPNFRLEFMDKHQKWNCENFLFPSFVANHVSGFLPKPVCGLLREKLWKGYEVEAKNPERKIYISRSKSTKRRIKNEAELLPILAKYGVEVVYPEELSYRDQVQLFFESRYIIGPHGAGFTNTFFSQKASVLELHPETAIKPHYFLLCKGLDFDYHYLVGSAADEKLDFTVSVEEFESKVREMLA